MNDVSTAVYSVASAIVAVLGVWASIRSWPAVRRLVLTLRPNWWLAGRVQTLEVALKEAVSDRDEARRSVTAAREAIELNQQTLEAMTRKIDDLVADVKTLREDADDNLEFTAALFQHIIDRKPPDDMPEIPEPLQGELFERLRRRADERLMKRAGDPEPAVEPA